ncbi:hypothetical protein L3Y34_009441 [Caenorhabditis briggsae]|uniref:Uncharacterized protein n=1 Tax=Caenorhabditis briggsae TaxID=6238 RepID=A0AAE9A5R1_CAEBR|nr:hypothetical protein L3Y34_009441 [Caenorhabditis briggsae]
MCESKSSQKKENSLNVYRKGLRDDNDSEESSEENIDDEDDGNNNNSFNPANTATSYMEYVMIKRLRKFIAARKGLHENETLA